MVSPKSGLGVYLTIGGSRTYENAANWQNYDFRDELRARLEIIEDDDTFIQTLNHFFSLLPSKVFCQMPGVNPEYLAINGLYTTPTTKLLEIRLPG